MEYSANVIYKGDLKCEVAKPGSQAVFTTDAKGVKESFSPTDVLSGALASCTASMIGFVAAQHGLDLKGLKVEVSKEMRENPTAVKAFKVKVTFPPAALDDGMKRRLEGAAKACPVKNSLDPAIEVASEFVY